MTNVEFTRDEATVIIALRSLMRQGPLAGVPRISYEMASSALSGSGGIVVPPGELEILVKRDVAHRWRLHLPQAFRPGWGHTRRDPSSPPGFYNVPEWIRRKVPDDVIEWLPIPDERLHSFIRQLDFVVMQRFAALLVDRLGWLVVDYGMGYQHGADGRAFMAEDGQVRMVVLEAKTGQKESSVGRSQVRKYMDAHAAERAVVLAPEVDRVPAATDVQTWGVQVIAAKMREAGLGMSATGHVDAAFVQDLHCYFAGR